MLLCFNSDLYLFFQLLSFIVFSNQSLCAETLSKRLKPPLLPQPPISPVTIPTSLSRPLEFLIVAGPTSKYN